MADKKTKNIHNIPGMFYVDEQCIACDACVVEASLFFSMNDIQGYAYVKRQPQTQKELEQCQNAMMLCPVDSIGNDGESVS